MGLALFLEGGEVIYHNLWLPGRFPLLFVYVDAGVGGKTGAGLSRSLQDLENLRASACVGIRYVDDTL